MSTKSARDVIVHALNARHEELNDGEAMPLDNDGARQILRALSDAGFAVVRVDDPRLTVHALNVAATHFRWDDGDIDAGAAMLKLSDEIRTAVPEPRARPHCTCEVGMGSYPGDHHEEGCQLHRLPKSAAELSAASIAAHQAKLRGERS